jgi:hypothetical protein
MEPSLEPIVRCWALKQADAKQSPDLCPLKALKKIGGEKLFWALPLKLFRRLAI